MPALFSLQCIALHMGIKFGLAFSLFRRWQYRLQHPVRRRFPKFSKWKVIQGLTTEKLRAQTTMSLTERAAAYEAENPGERLSRHDLGQIYRQLKIRRKLIRK